MLQVENSHKLSLPMLGDYCDGQHYQDHHLFKADPLSLQIILYYDELELCNPLGSRRKKHKIGMLFSLLFTHMLTVLETFKPLNCIGAFYYILGNLRPQLRSIVSTIQLLALTKYTTVADFGIDRIIEPLVEDLRKLESVGVNIQCICCVQWIFFYLGRGSDVCCQWCPA